MNPRTRTALSFVLALSSLQAAACKKSKTGSNPPSLGDGSATPASGLTSASAKALAGKLEKAKKPGDVEAALVPVSMPIAAKGEVEKYLSEIGPLTRCEPDEEGQEAKCHFAAKLKEKIDPRRIEAHWDCLDEKGAALRKGYYLSLVPVEDETPGEPVRFDVPMRECWEYPLRERRSSQREDASACSAA